MDHPHDPRIFGLDHQVVVVGFPDVQLEDPPDCRVRDPFGHPGEALFELLAGHPPFDGETPFEILDQHRKAPLPDLAALRPDLPRPLVDLVERLCRKDPDQRPDDAEVLRVLADLEAALPGPSRQD